MNTKAEATAPPAAPEAQESYIVSEGKKRGSTRDVRPEAAFNRYFTVLRVHGGDVVLTDNWHTNEVLAHTRNNFEGYTFAMRTLEAWGAMIENDHRAYYTAAGESGSWIWSPAKARSRACRAPGRARSSLRRILLIDDTPEIAELLTFALRDHGYEVFADGYNTGVNELIKEQHADALVLDCTSYDMSEALFDAVRHHPITESFLSSSSAILRRLRMLACGRGRRAECCSFLNRSLGRRSRKRSAICWRHDLRRMG